MLESLPVALAVSTILGFLAGIGVGGGSLLIMWLTLVLGLDQSEARILNLLFFLPTAVITSLFRWKHGQLDIKKILPAIIFGCIAAAIASYISKGIDTALLRKLFGAILLGTGIREVLYKPRKKQGH